MIVSDSNKKGSINLLGVFDHAAISILHSIEEGKILHQTKNIKDSGAAFEAEIRSFFERFLPKKYDVKHGYLVDSNSTCSPQVDLIFTLRDRTQTFLTSPDGSAYIPFTENLMIGEIKSSGNKYESHLEQINKTKIELHRMRTNQLNYGPKLPAIETTMIFGKIDDTDTMNLVNFMNSLDKNNPTKPPESILLLEKGSIILRENSLSVLFTEHNDQPIEFDPRTDFDSGNFVLYEPSEKDRRIGAMLLWYFYYVYYRLEKHENGSYLNSPFIDLMLSKHEIKIKVKQ